MNLKLTNLRKKQGNFDKKERILVAENQIEKITAIVDPNNFPSRKILTNNNKFVSEKKLKTEYLEGEVLGLQIK